MKIHLEQVAEGFQTVSNERAGSGTFAIINRTEMVALARAMSDSQSAILFCLAWHTAIQARMQHGPLAGRRVARVSASRLAEITGRPLRTTRWALSRLISNATIVRESIGAGRTSIYELRLQDADISVDLANSSQACQDEVSL